MILSSIYDLQMQKTGSKYILKFEQSSINVLSYYVGVRLDKANPVRTLGNFVYFGVNQ